MRVKDVKRIVKLVQMKDLIEDFVIKSDLSVSAVDPTNVTMVRLQYYGDQLDSDIPISGTRKFLEVLSKFSDDAELRYENGLCEIVEDGQRATIRSPSHEWMYHEDKDFGWSFDYEVEVELDDLKKAVSNKVREFEELYIFSGKDDGLYLTVGDDETITRKLVDGKYDLKAAFSENLPKIVSVLETDPVLCLKSDYLILIKSETDEYKVEYAIAPRILEE